MPRAADRRDLRHRIGEDLVLAQPLIGELVDEARIRAILEQPPHEIREQIAVPTNGGIDAAVIAMLAHQPLVEAITHPVEALEFEIAAVARPVDDRRHRQRIVAGECGPDMFGLQHVARAGEVGHIGRRLAGEQRIVAQTLDLRALDLRVPIGALDQPHVHHPAEPVRPSDHRPRALAVSLHRHAEAVPPVERGKRGDGPDDVEAHLEPLGLLGVDRQRDTLARGLHCQGFEHFGKRGHALVPARDFVAGMERRELDRNRMARRSIAADRVDRLHIGTEVTRRIRVGPRRFPKHVEAGSEAGMLRFGHAPHRFVNRAPHDEDFAHHLHGRPHRLADERFARARDEAAQRRLLLALAHQRAADHQPPGRGVDERG